MNRNRWPTWIGIGGRNASEYAELGVQELRDELKEKGLNVADSKLRDILKKSVNKGVFTERKVGRRKMVYGLKPIS